MRELLRSMILLVVAGSGCSFARFPSELRQPTLAAEPPCFAGDVCAIGSEGAGFVWLRDTFAAAR